MHYSQLSISLFNHIKQIHWLIALLCQNNLQTIQQFQTISNCFKTVSNKFQERFQHNTLPKLMRYIDIFYKYQYFKNINI